MQPFRHDRNPERGAWVFGRLFGRGVGRGVRLVAAHDTDGDALRHSGLLRAERKQRKPPMSEDSGGSLYGERHAVVVAARASSPTSAKMA